LQIGLPTLCQHEAIEVGSFLSKLVTIWPLVARALGPLELEDFSPTEFHVWIVAPHHVVIFEY